MASDGGARGQDGQIDDVARSDHVRPSQEAAETNSALTVVGTHLFGRHLIQIASVEAQTDQTLAPNPLGCSQA